jgi:hypothetical protein
VHGNGRGHAQLQISRNDQGVPGQPVRLTVESFLAAVRAGKRNDVLAMSRLLPTDPRL